MTNQATVLDIQKEKDHFDELAIKELIVKANQKIKDYENRPLLKFPVDALPSRLAEVVSSYYNSLGLPAEYFATTMLTTIGCLLGNAYAIKEPRGGVHPPILYTLNVGPPSIGKTPAVTSILKPIFEIERKNRQAYADQMRLYKELIEDEKEATEPSASQTLMNDTTVEELVKVMEKNPRGLLVFHDEASSWISQMSRYNSSDQSFWLGTWSGSPIKVNRVGRGVVFVERPSVGVISSIQPGILKKIAENGKDVDGFFARLLFAYPDNTLKKQYSKTKPDLNLIAWWEYCVEWVNNLPNAFVAPEDEFGDWTINRIELELTREAEKAYIEWYNKNVEAINEANDEVIEGILGKFDSYCLRFSLILEMMERAINNNSKKGFEDSLPTWNEVIEWKITELSMKRAIMLVNYFKTTSLKVVNRLQSPVEQLPDNEKLWYDSLPHDENITTKMALKLGKTCGLEERQIYRLLGNQKIELFNRLKRGVYERKYF